MSRIALPSPESTPAASNALLEAVHKQLGVIPNLYRTVALSPAALQALLGLGGALDRTLDAKNRQRVALAVAQVNGCDYCLSAHTYLGEHVAKLGADEIALARAGSSADAKASAAVGFAAAVARTRGKVSDRELAAVRAAGFTDAQIIELVGVVVQNVFTNFVNNVAQTAIDFPVVHAADRIAPVETSQAAEAI